MLEVEVHAGFTADIRILVEVIEAAMTADIQMLLSAGTWSLKLVRRTVAASDIA